MKFQKIELKLIFFHESRVNHFGECLKAVVNRYKTRLKIHICVTNFVKEQSYLRHSKMVIGNP